MKYYTLYTLIFGFLFSFNANSQTSSIKKNINIETSIVKWTGYKITGQHEGTISLAEGHLSFTEDKISGGYFKIDMSTINTTDLSGRGKNSLDNHLKSDDFFDTEKYKTAELTITGLESTSQTSYIVSGDMTIKGITNPIKFELDVKDGTAETNLKIDRTKFNIKYKSASFFDNLKNKAIYDEFDLKVSLNFK